MRYAKLNGNAQRRLFITLLSRKLFAVSQNARNFSVIFTIFTEIIFFFSKNRIQPGFIFSKGTTFRDQIQFLITLIL